MTTIFWGFAWLIVIILIIYFFGKAAQMGKDIWGDENEGDYFSH